MGLIAERLTGIVSALDFGAPNGARHVESVLEKSVNEVDRLRIGAAEQLHADGGLLGAVAALEPVGQRLQLVDAVTEHGRRRRHGH